ncbi:MAG: HEAT repeat domain-containing protein [Leptolyngbyaceae cyanobacterium SM1_3_5]|nr:HEAT repeat domain-containing protein [Leptolyngbyaceae cyanobacterium SM1_3_5]
MAESSEYQSYIDQLHSHNSNLVIEAAYSLGNLGCKQSVPALIEVLQTTTDPSVRNAVAIGLQEIGDERALCPLVSIIVDPKTEGYRGTLIYALEGFDCSCILPLLVELVIAGNFEVSHQAFLIIESIKTVVDKTTLNLCIKKVQDTLLSANGNKSDLLEDLIQLLDKISAYT